jgi:hypothetical protein
MNHVVRGCGMLYPVTTVVPVVKQPCATDLLPLLLSRFFAYSGGTEGREELRSMPFAATSSIIMACAAS